MSGSSKELIEELKTSGSGTEEMTGFSRAGGRGRLGVYIHNIEVLGEETDLVLNIVAGSQT